MISKVLPSFVVPVIPRLKTKPLQKRSFLVFLVCDSERVQCWHIYAQTAGAKTGRLEEMGPRRSRAKLFPSGR